jgi:hypothetical protein
LLFAEQLPHLCLEEELPGREAVRKSKYPNWATSCFETHDLFVIKDG